MRVVQHPPADERDPDPTLVGLRDRAVRHRRRRAQPAARRARLGADLLQPQHVRLLLIDHRRSDSIFAVKLRLGVGAVLVADVEQVLDVPRHHPKLAHDQDSPAQMAPHTNTNSNGGASVGRWRASGWTSI